MGPVVTTRRVDQIETIEGLRHREHDRSIHLRMFVLEQGRGVGTDNSCEIGHHSRGLACGGNGAPERHRCGGTDSKSPCS